MWRDDNTCSPVSEGSASSRVFSSFSLPAHILSLQHQQILPLSVHVFLPSSQKLSRNLQRNYLNSIQGNKGGKAGLSTGRKKRKMERGFKYSGLLSRCKADRPYCVIESRKSVNGKQDAAELLLRELMLWCRGKEANDRG